MKSTDILRKYTEGNMSLQEANAALKECRAGVHLDPQRNYISPAERELYGLLDTGTGSLDKVRIHTDQHLANADCGDMPGICHFNGKTFRVHGTTLGEELEI